VKKVGGREEGGKSSLLEESPWKGFALFLLNEL
jgi:hypothetical protein